MKSIRKSPEPVSLTTYRNTQAATYGNFPQKQDLRDSLVREQRGVCCFCLSRIRPDLNSMKIAHWLPQNPGLPAGVGSDLAYSNLLGACKGNEGQPDQFTHCDTRQKNRLLTRNPANPGHRLEDLIHYGSFGEIKSDDGPFDHDLNEILNLNQDRLKRNRKAVLDGFIAALPNRGVLLRSDLERDLRKWNGESTTTDLEPFCMVVVYWLRKRLRRN